ncbi:astacin [Ancylostoma ceylanicum]|uniref:Zinc metalloproteinase n=1 Tax=Ancylostoma ceylanicum TaxID=53326 RepID=A0A0D6LWR4_9BILA|nr:astacin [Ancylostoma ceylanicum]
MLTTWSWFRDEARELIEDEEEELSRHKRQAQRRNASNENLWVDGVKYVFDPNASQKLKDGFTLAVNAWQKDTCINFTLVQTREEVKGEDYLYVTTDETDPKGCLSHVGKLGGYQPIFLGDGCESFPHAAHEVGHALGMYHTQTRHDRDKYIHLKDDNIEEEYKEQYLKLTEEKNENYGFPYDYGSIMHYGSSVENPWMVPFDANYKTTMGSPFISFIDLFMMNTHYNCTDICDPKTSAQCENGGFPHPRKCDECICPGGYGGALCNQRPQDCADGKTLEASDGWKSLEANIHKTKDDGTYATCTYWITAPDDKKIEIEIESINTKEPTIGCAKGGVEIKANENHTLTGYRCDIERDARFFLDEEEAQYCYFLYYPKFLYY